ncbi:MAG: glycosyltransferase [Candidatus Aegiribacteria sp.]|nr:glycosyltransferase [Candidatus Aegiribacteria sp.]
MNPVPFWIVLGLFLSPWLIYPSVLFCISIFFRKYSSSWKNPEEWPKVSILIAARNEEAVIASRIRNLLEQNYEGSIEILIGSDSSDDETDTVAGSFRDQGVILHRSENRIGKPLMIKKLLEMSKGEIIVFSDADTVFASNTVTELVIPFSNPSVGCVDGSRRNSLDGDTCESIYWKYETLIKKMCSCFGAVLGATGAVFALRRDLFMPLSPRRADDFELAVMTRVQGGSCVFNENAVAAEPSPDDAKQFRRMVRIVSWMFISGILLMGKALKKRSFLLFLQLLVHKVLRWFSGLFLAAATVLAGFLAGGQFYLILFFLMCLFHATAVAGWRLKQYVPSKLLFPYYFWLMSIASLNGILRILSGNPVETWEKKSKGRKN